MHFESKKKFFDNILQTFICKRLTFLPRRLHLLLLTAKLLKSGHMCKRARRNYMCMHEQVLHMPPKRQPRRAFCALNGRLSYCRVDKRLALRHLPHRLVCVSHGANLHLRRYSSDFRRQPFNSSRDNCRRTAVSKYSHRCDTIIAQT